MNRKALAAAIAVILLAMLATQSVPAKENIETETAATEETVLDNTLQDNGQQDATYVYIDNDTEQEHAVAIEDETTKSNVRRIALSKRTVFCSRFADADDGTLPRPDNILEWKYCYDDNTLITQAEEQPKSKIGTFPYTKTVLMSPFNGYYFTGLGDIPNEKPEEEPIPKLPPLRPDKESDDAIRSYIVSMARLYIDKIEYSFIGGESSLDERTTDCSGFVWQIYTICGLSKSYGKYNTCTGIMLLSQDPESTRFTEIPLEDALPGDLIIFESTDEMKEREPDRPYSHVAIYTGEGTVVHVTRSRDVSGCIESDLHYRGEEFDDKLHAIRVDLSPDTGREAEVKRIYTMRSENGVFGILPPETIETLTELADDVSDVCEDALDASYGLEDTEDEEIGVPAPEAVIEAVEDATETLSSSKEDNEEATEDSEETTEPLQKEETPDEQEDETGTEPVDAQESTSENTEGLQETVGITDE